MGAEFVIRPGKTERGPSPEGRKKNSDTMRYDAVRRNPQNDLQGSRSTPKSKGRWSMPGVGRLQGDWLATPRHARSRRPLSPARLPVCRVARRSFSPLVTRGKFDVGRTRCRVAGPTPHRTHHRRWRVWFDTGLAGFDLRSVRGLRPRYALVGGFLVVARGDRGASDPWPRGLVATPAADVRERAYLGPLIYWPRGHVRRGCPKTQRARRCCANHGRAGTLSRESRLYCGESIHDSRPRNQDVPLVRPLRAAQSPSAVLAATSLALSSPPFPTAAAPSDRN